MGKIKSLGEGDRKIKNRIGTKNTRARRQDSSEISNVAYWLTEMEQDEEAKIAITVNY